MLIEQKPNWWDTRATNRKMSYAFDGVTTEVAIPEPVRLTCCSHERQLFTLETAREVLDYLVRCTAKHLHEFDAIAVSGYSSAMIAPALAMAINKNIVLVRKPSEHRNSGYAVEGVHNQRVLFVDDLVASGSTFGRVQQGLLDIGCVR